MEENKKPIEIIIDNIKISGTFYTEFTDQSINASLESCHHPDLIREFGIDKIIQSDKGYILKWYKRPWILTDAELLEKHGICYFRKFNYKSEYEKKRDDKARKQRRTTKPDSSQGD